MRVLIVDDEPLARQWIREHLKDDGRVELVGEARDGPDAVAQIHNTEPDLVFLDVEMPGLDGIEVLQRVRHDPYVVFTTAFDRYAVTAFELHALDYLLKPFTKARLTASLDRALADPRRSQPSTADRVRLATDPSPLQRLFVRTRGKIIPIDVTEIDRLQAQKDYVAAWVGDREHLLSTSFQGLLARLADDAFLRIHRSHAVNIRSIAEMSPTANGRIDVVMKNGDRLTASRTYAARLRELVF